MQRVGPNDDIVHSSSRTDGLQKISITPSELRPIRIRFGAYLP